MPSGFDLIRACVERVISPHVGHIRLNRQDSHQGWARTGQVN